MQAFARTVRGAAAAVVIAACNLSGAMPSMAQTAETVTVTGVLTDEGAECPAMRGDDGELYTLTPRGVTGDMGPGDRVRVTGTTPEMSICQQGITIQVETIEPAS